MPYFVKMQTPKCLHSTSVEIVSLLELVNASACIDELLLAREVGMALGANFHLHFLHGLCRAGEECVSASASDGDGVVIGMNTLFHCHHSYIRFFTPTRAACAYMT